jgi:hypothetical protein
MTECKQETFSFTAHFAPRGGRVHGRVGYDRRRWVAAARGGRKLNLIDRLAACFTDCANQESMHHHFPAFRVRVM